MKIFAYESDPRQFDSDFRLNHGSFSTIHFGLNDELKKLNLYAPLEEADWIVFATGIDVNFLPHITNKNKLLINVWETNELPDYLLQARKVLEGPNYVWAGLSPQVSYAYRKYGFLQTPVINIGVDTDFWQRERKFDYNEKFDKFKLLTTLSCNWRSGINHVINTLIKLNEKFPNVYSLTIKDTEDRNEKLPVICRDLRAAGIDVTYECRRANNIELKNLMLSHHLCLPLNTCTSAGLNFLECAALKLPHLSPDYCPCNIYPYSEKVKTSRASISKVKDELTRTWGLPYTFPQNWIDESKAELNWIDEQNLFDKIELVRNNYRYFQGLAEDNRERVKKDWTWKNSCEQLIKIIENYGKYN